MMPKGVEHEFKDAQTQILFTVKIPMMPKGVEHKKLGIVADVFPPCEDSNDAERR